MLRGYDDNCENEDRDGTLIVEEGPGASFCFDREDPKGLIVPYGGKLVARGVGKTHGSKLVGCYLGRDTIAFIRTKTREAVSC